MSSSVVPPANDAAPPQSEVLELVHHHPGRLRVRAVVLQGEGPLVSDIERALESVAGISRVQHNPKTGSLLVEYEPGLAEPEAIVERIATTAGLMSPFDPRAVRPVVRPATTVIDAARGLNAAVEELTGKRADLRTLVPAALAGAAAYSFAFGKGPRLPRWDNLLYWSYTVFSQLHASEISKAPPGEGDAPT